MRIETPRLVLRGWRAEDLDPLAAMGSDDRTMRFFHIRRDRAASRAWLDRVQRHIAEKGFGLWAVEVPGVAPLIGFVGLSTVPASLPAAPAVEGVWTLSADWWGRGYAAEAARAAFADGFDRVGLAEIVAFTAVPNLPSQVLMRRLGMHRDPEDDFDHPAVPAGHALRPHVLYRLRREEFPREAG